MTVIRKGDWIADTSDRVARVKAVYVDGLGTAMDIVFYSNKGERLGRISPACGGPKHFEPACSLGGWRRIAKPSFPIRLVWVRNGNIKTARYWPGETLP